MSKPPKIVVPGLNRGAGIPPGYVLGRPQGTGKGPAQLLNLLELRRVGLATAAGATQSTSTAISTAHSETVSLSSSVSTAISGSISIVNSRIDSLSTAGGGGGGTGTSTSLSQISSSLSSEISTDLSRATSLSTVISGSISTVNSRVDSLSTAGGGGTGSGRVLIEDRVLGADSATVHFTGIPTTYADLEIEYELRNGTGGTAPASLVFNGDAATNYTTASWNKFGSSANGGANSVQFGGLEDDAATAESYNIGKATIFGYASTTRYKGLIGQSIYPSIATIEQYGGEWRSNAAINELLLVTTAGPLFKAGSRIRIYGIA